MNITSRILICPLDWGLGHACRDAYLINRLLENGFEVIIGGEGASLEFLKTEFPGLKYIHLPSFQIRFSRKYPAWLMITLLLPCFFTWVIREKNILHHIIRQYEIDLVISDTRYGLWSKIIPSVIITHQVSFRLPFIFIPFQYIVFRINAAAIRRFSQCWIPDYPGYPNLSGELSHRYKLPANSIFTGPLSRFLIIENETDLAEKFDIAVILSGPEPQRSVFEELITEQLIRCKRKSIIVRGKPNRKESENLTATCTRISYLTGAELAVILKSSKYIICRSGYSTIMDLVALKKTAFLVPTPGQTEQEYLARYLEKQCIFLCSEQRDFNLEEAVRRLDKFRPDMQFSNRSDLLNKAIDGVCLLIEKRNQG